MVKSQGQGQPENQNQNQEYSIANEEIGEPLLLRCWNGVVSQVNEAITINKNSGVNTLTCIFHIMTKWDQWTS